MTRRAIMRRRATALGLGALVVAMIGLSYASVPLYDLFCRVTGYGGTTQRADAAPATLADRTIDVRFNADVARDMPWRFQPMQRSLRVRPGAETLAYYRAHNPTERAITGMATFNVTPDKAGKYFVKIACFCFEEQRLEPGQTIDMPVSFFVDPAMASDPHAADLDTITLSYTFFARREGPAAAHARTFLAVPTTKE